MKRRVVLISLLALAISVGIGSAAQDSSVEPRIVQIYDDFTTGTGLFSTMPTETTGSNLGAYTLEIGEPQSSCAPSVEARSAWFSVILPGGTLHVDTTFGAGTNYDTLITVFEHTRGPIADLHELACVDNTSGDKAILNKTLPSGAYAVRITCIGACGAPLLSVSIAYTPSQTAPNDLLAGAAQLIVNKAVKSKLVGFATAGDENVALTCEMYNSVWYKFTAPATGGYSFTTAGSMFIGPQFDTRDTVLAVYTSSSATPVYTDLTELDCADTTFGTQYASSFNLLIPKGTMVYVRAGSSFNVNFLPASLMRVKVTTPLLNNLITNGEFSPPLDSSGWVLKNPTAGDGITSEISISGPNCMKLAGAPGKNTTLKQSFDLAANSLQLPKDTTLSFGFFYMTNGTIAPNVKASLKITYSDGTPATKLTRKLLKFVPAATFTSSVTVAALASPNATRLTVTVKAKNATGLVYLDAVTLTYHGELARGVPSGVLPLPAPK